MLYLYPLHFGMNGIQLSQQVRRQRVARLFGSSKAVGQYGEGIVLRSELASLLGYHIEQHLIEIEGSRLVLQFEGIFVLNNTLCLRRETQCSEQYYEDRSFQKYQLSIICRVGI